MSDFTGLEFQIAPAARPWFSGLRRIGPVKELDLRAGRLRPLRMSATTLSLATAFSSLAFVAFVSLGVLGFLYLTWTSEGRFAV